MSPASQALRKADAVDLGMKYVEGAEKLFMQHGHDLPQRDSLVRGPDQAALCRARTTRSASSTPEPPGQSPPPRARSWTGSSTAG